MDRPTQIWNCDESGFSLCPKSGKVLAQRGSAIVYHSSSSKGQITTTLACISVAGGIIPPMYAFPGVYPMEGCVEGAYFGKSENGWITQELFYGWVTKHLVRNLVLSASWLMDILPTRFCQENGILLYCLPPHSSHTTQPLDVGFFSALKGAWKKAVMSYNTDHPGVTVSKTTFSRVFREAYIQIVKPETIINAFKH